MKIKGTFRGVDWTWKETALGRLLPDDYKGEASVSELLPVYFDLAEASSLYNPERNQFFQRGDIRGFLLPNVTFWPSAGACRTRNGILVRDSFHSVGKLESAKQLRLLKRYPLIRASTTAASLGHTSRNYYHRFIDSIPRVYALNHPDLLAHEAIELFIDQRFSAQEELIIQAMLPPNVVVRKVPFGSRVHTPTYVHLPFLSSDRTGFSKWFDESGGFLPIEYIEFYLSKVLPLFGIQRRKPWRKLYVSRKNARVRRIKNETQISECLQRNGFEVVYFEDMGLPDQIRIMAEAQTVVAQHGAGLTNILYMQPETRVVEIMSSEDKLIHYSLLSRSLGIQHTQIYSPGRDKNADIFVEPDALLEAVA